MRPIALIKEHPSYIKTVVKIKDRLHSILNKQLIRGKTVSLKILSEVAFMMKFSFAD